MIGLGTFTAIGLLLVIIGVFSVMAYTVSLRTHEIGVRMALGAQQGDVLRMVLKRGLVLVIEGALVGVFVSVATTRLMASQIWGVSATDPWTFAVVAIVIVAVGLAACFSQPAELVKSTRWSPSASSDSVSRVGN